MGTYADRGKEEPGADMNLNSDSSTKNNAYKINHLTSCFQRNSFKMDKNIQLTVIYNHRDCNDPKDFFGQITSARQTCSQNASPVSSLIRVFF